MRSRLVLLLGAASLTACASLGPVAPPVTPAMITAGGGNPAARLEAGRRILGRQCTSCHSADPIAKYTASEWSAIVADMSGRAHLDAKQEQELLAYLTAARTTVAAQH